MAWHDVFTFGFLANAVDSKWTRVVDGARIVVVHEHAQKVVVLDLPLQVIDHLKLEALAE